MTSPGAAAFDFIHGTWTVHNRKLRDVTDPACDEWVEFAGTSEAVPVLQGVGHLDRMTVPEAPDGPGFEGLTLRLFDPSAQVWRIWWSSSRAPGQLDPPLVGRFSDGLGIFEGDDVVGGRPVLLRFAAGAPSCCASSGGPTGPRRAGSSRSPTTAAPPGPSTGS